MKESNTVYFVADNFAASLWKALDVNQFATNGLGAQKQVKY